MVELTGTVVIVNVAVVAPEVTTTLAGGVALPELEDSVTEVPPVGAAPLSVTLPMEEELPTTVVGLSVKAVRVAGLIVRLAVFDALYSVPVIVADTEVATGMVVTVNVAEVAPAATTTEVGTVAPRLFELRATVLPPAGAGPVSVTVPAELAPPVTEVGESETLWIDAAVIAG